MSQSCAEGTDSLPETSAEPSAPRERPILFSAPMVRAILDGRKTQTRRVVKGPWLEWADSLPSEGAHAHVGGPYGDPGDVLWVRETFRLDVAYDNDKPSEVSGRAAVWYEADQSAVGNGVSGKTRVSIHMPRWASRITLRVTDVRVERLHEISEADAQAEGAPCGGFDDEGHFYQLPEGNHRCGFAGLWQHINGPSSWDANPWVWVVAFERADAARSASPPSSEGESSREHVNPNLPTTTPDAEPSAE